MSIYDERPWLSLYDEGMATDIEVEYDNCLEMFKASVGRAADRPLIHYFEKTFTLAEVDRLSDALAVGLRDLGIEHGDRVAVYLQNVPQFLLSMIATWKAGAIMVSVNPMNRQRELELLLGDCDAKVLVTHESLYGEVAASVLPSTSVVAAITTSELDFLDTVPELLSQAVRQRHDGTHDLLELVHEREGRQLEPPTLRAGDVAFLTYTSGTTGPPKGAMNTHGNVVFNSQTYREWCGLNADRDVVLGVAPIFHITGLIGHLGVSMLTPMPLILGYRFDPAVTLELIERHKATFTVGSITVFISLLNHPDAEHRDVSSLTRIWSGGAPIPPATTDAFEQKFGAYIHNIYGLTETTSPSHGVPFEKRAPVDEAYGALSVGVPIFSTVVRIVDEEGNDLPPGEIGEIVTDGPEVVPGYWEKPEETANALPGGALHTGDVGFMDEHGWFYVVDRMKDQINASGYKVWPREVEDVLYEHPAVLEAAVVGVPDPYRGETVKAFVSLRPGQTADEAALVTFCKERMAAYKYPRSVEILTELPKTVTGKVLRRELRANEIAKTGT
ncbi:MAG: AMP-binding protein [Solirubrobacterales bacterium]|nr:AMP-binding protein [Solirubrobacterales bacterium]MBV9715982.1 AMP-binding protein [Solirubrobacterales bacterium]